MWVIFILIGFEWCLMCWFGVFDGGFDEYDLDDMCGCLCVCCCVCVGCMYVIDWWYLWYVGGVVCVVGWLWCVVDYDDVGCEYVL